MVESTVQHIITENTAEGKATFHELPEKPKTISGPYGSSTHVYINPTFLPEVSAGATADLTATAEHSQTGLANMKGRICIDDGMTAVILVVNPGIVVPMHRTRTVDVGIVIEGEIELHLDDGDKRSLRQGDTFALRGAMHKWANVSDKPARMYGVTIDAKIVRDGAGNELKEEFAEPFL